MKATIDQLRAKYADTSYPSRLDDAQSLADALEGSPLFFVRDTEEVANVVWLQDGIIFDVTWFPEADPSTVNIRALRDVVAFEVREAPNVVRTIYETVGGDFIVKVVAPDQLGSLYWAASAGAEADALQAFFQQVLRAYASAKQNGSD